MIFNEENYLFHQHLFWILFLMIIMILLTFNIINHFYFNYQINISTCQVFVFTLTSLGIIVIIIFATHMNHLFMKNLQYFKLILYISS